MKSGDTITPRAYATKGYRSHAAEPNFWPQPEPEKPSESRWPWGALMAFVVAGLVSGAAFWALAKLAGLSGVL
jgi:hypothetical protein